jgi:hypothetical protein
MPDGIAKLFLLLALSGILSPAEPVNRFTYEGRNRKISTPAYTVDVALRVKRVSGSYNWSNFGV